MSVITNKDRINENNNKINSLIGLAKQKGLTSNPKIATTEDEMTAMITDKNVGKVVKYLGESGGKYEKDALYIIAEGNETDSGLFARRLNITEGSLSITENGTYDVTNKASVEVNVAGSGGSASNKLALVVGAQSADNPYDITASDLEGVTALGENAFSYKKGLERVELPTICVSIGKSAFSNCTSLKSISMPNVTSIGDYAFNGCTALTSASMPNVTSIEQYAFDSCSALTSIDMPNVTSIGRHAFDSCALTSVDMPNVIGIGERGFWYCESLTSVSMPNARGISADLFYACTSLKSISMPNVTRIGQYAFEFCTSLTSLTIPSTCTQINGEALRCGSSTNKCTFIFEGTTPPIIYSSTFYKSYLNKIIVPIGYGETYKTATNWSSFADYIEEATE